MKENGAKLLRTPHPSTIPKKINGSLAPTGPIMHGYLKNEIDDMSENETQQVRLLAQQFVAFSTADRVRLCAEGRLIPLKG
jgi:hypothetical protein